jgi:hypothetical protein
VKQNCFKLLFVDFHCTRFTVSNYEVRHKKIQLCRVCVCVTSNITEQDLHLGGGRTGLNEDRAATETSCITGTIYLSQEPG